MSLWSWAALAYFAAARAAQTVNGSAKTEITNAMIEIAIMLRSFHGGQTH